MSGSVPGQPRRTGGFQADAFRYLGLDRREALWAVQALDARVPPNVCRYSIGPARLRDNEPRTELPRMPLGEHVVHDTLASAIR